MKKLLVGLIFLFLLNCKSKIESQNKQITTTSEALKTTVSYLASDEMEGRNTGSKGIDKAAAFIEKQFKSLQIDPYFKTYRDHFKVDSLDAYNVVGFLEGMEAKLKDEVIIFGAHYDHIGYRKAIDNDSIANGANDNAAGTTTVLTLAKYFSALRNNKRSLMFVLFSAEERGLLGSKHLAKKLKAENLNLYVMINFEMTGTPMDNKNYLAYVTGHKTSNMASKFNEYSQDKSFLGNYELAETYKLFQRSDNYPFFQEFNVPSQTFSTSDDYKFYHHVDDEVDKLDFEHMAKFINKLAPALQRMINASTQEIKLINE